MSTEKILEERGRSYGPFEDNADVSQRLKRVIQQRHTAMLTDVQKEAIELICLKISRIVTGDSKYKDNWADIAGYAQLVVNDIERNERIIEKEKFSNSKMEVPLSVQVNLEGET